MSVIDVRRDDLFMLLADAPEGVTITHIQQTLNLTLTQAKQAIQALRLFLGEDDEINVPCDPPVDVESCERFRDSSANDDGNDGFDREGHSRQLDRGQEGATDGDIVASPRRRS